MNNPYKDPLENSIECIIGHFSEMDGLTDLQALSVLDGVRERIYESMRDKRRDDNN